MPKRVLDVGNCAPDHAALTRFLCGNFAVEVEQAHQLADTLAALRSGQFDLVLVNRKLDIDYSDGLDIIRKLKADPELAAIPAMLVSNLAEHQAEAVAAGALRGFGKLEFDQPQTLKRLQSVLNRSE